MKLQLSLNGKTLKAIASTVAILGCIMTIKGDDVPPAECKVAMGEIIKDQLAKFKLCLSEMEFASGKEKSEKMMCIIACAMRKSGFLNENNALDPMASLAYLEKHVPQALQNKVMETFMSCEKHLGDLATVTDDPRCRGLEPLMKCTQAAMNKVCV